MNHSLPTVGLATLDQAYRSGGVQGVSVVMTAPRAWYLAVEVRDPVSGASSRVALHTKTGRNFRTWKTPQSIFSLLLDRYGVTSGTFTLETKSENEQAT